MNNKGINLERRETPEEVDYAGPDPEISEYFHVGGHRLLRGRHHPSHLGTREDAGSRGRPVGALVHGYHLLRHRHGDHRGHLPAV